MTLDGKEVSLQQLEEAKKSLQESKNVKIVEVAPGQYKTKQTLNG